MEKKRILQGVSLSGKICRLAILPDQRFSINFHKDGFSCELPLNLKNINVENHTITLGKKVKVVEHLFSALYGLNVFHVKIDIYSEELPFFDGSSIKFVKILKDLPIERNTEMLKINKKIIVQEGNSFILLEPTNDNFFLIDMMLKHPYIGEQRLNLAVTEENYIKEIAPARTFVFTNETDPRLKNLPPYGIGITARKIYSIEPLRFPDEPVRHKILDLLGDLFLLRKGLVGKITARNTYHRLNLKFIRAIAKLYKI